MSRTIEYTEDDEKSLREEPSKGEEIEDRKPAKPSSLLGRIREFYHQVKLEMRKTSWPTRGEVWSTTVIVLIAVVFFGFYLWGVDLLVTFGFESLEKTIK